MDVPQACSQSLQRAELKLLHRTLGASQLAGDLANGLLLDEALHDDTLLVAWQAANQLGEQGTAVDVGQVPVVGRLRRRRGARARRALPAIGDGVPGHLHQPRHEGDASPLEAAEMNECMVKDLSGQVLGLDAIPGAPGDERVYALEVALVQLGEAARVRLGGLEQEPLVFPAEGVSAARARGGMPSYPTAGAG
jgi:hypothetical protein